MSDQPIIVRTTRLSVLPKGEPIFSERCTHITIDDEAAGEYLAVEQQSESGDVKPQVILLDPSEWPVLRGAIDQMMEEITKHETKP